jgi:hypothetical protein
MNKTKREYPEPEDTIYHCDICVHKDELMEVFGHVIVEHTVEEIVSTMLESGRQRRKLELITHSMWNDKK